MANVTRTTPGIKNVSTARPLIRALIAGHPGSGKTPMIATGERTFIIDADGGIESAMMTRSKAKYVRAKTYEDINEIHDYLRYDEHGFNWVWIDSMTLMQDQGLMDDIMLKAVKKTPSRSPLVPDKREYLLSINSVLEIVRGFRMLPLNFGITTHIRMAWGVGEEEDETPSYEPLLQGKDLVPKVCGYMNVIGFLEPRMVKVNGQVVERRRLFTQSSKKYPMARDRFGSLGRWIDDPSIPKIEAMIQAHRPQKPTVSAKRPTTKRKATA